MISAQPAATGGAPQAFKVEAAAERNKRKAAQNTPLIHPLGLAQYWQFLLDEGKMRTIADIASLEKIDVKQARADVFDYVERLYNSTRRHSSLGYVRSIQFEEALKA
jgi:hypothetical protein